MKNYKPVDEVKVGIDFVAGVKPVGSLAISPSGAYN